MADRAGSEPLVDAPYPPVPQGVFGVCEGCGAVAWELLDGRSKMCMGCDSAAYRQDDECGDCNGRNCYCDEAE